MSMNLLEKTELWINHITLNDVNLTELADTVAGVLGLQKGEVIRQGKSYFECFAGNTGSHFI